MPRLLPVNGLPGSLGLPLYRKDVVKETLFDRLGVGDREWSRTLGAAALEVIWSLLADVPGAAVYESWFSPAARDLVGAGLTRSGARDVLELWCDVQPEVALARYAVRAASRHAGHNEATVLAGEADRWVAENRPLAFGPVLRVPTDGPVDLGSVTAWVAARRPPETVGTPG